MRKRLSQKGEQVQMLSVKLDVQESPMMEMGNNKKIARSKKAPLREVQMLGNQNLYQFAEAIIDAFGFDFDHCFGFFDNYQSRFLGDSKEAYELFVDIGEDPPEGSKAVKTARIKDVFDTLGGKMLFYFDYGDGWRFIVTYKETMPANARVKYPQLGRFIGKNPEQYPIIEEL